MSPEAQLVLRQDPTKVARLDPSRPLTIGRARNNALCLASWEAVAPHHAVVRFSLEHGWLVCDWGSPLGTFCGGRRVHHCQPLRDGDAIALGQEGPVLLFQHQAGITPPPRSTAPPLLAAPATTPARPLGLAPVKAPPPTTADASSAASAQARATVPNPIRGSQGSGLAAAANSGDRRPPLQLGGREVPLAAIRSAEVLSRPRPP
ncbi:MAG: FHA domain-containing protein, partial [Synechococcaceae cyanobacterium]